MAFLQGPESTKKGRNESSDLLKVLLVIPAITLFVPLSPLPLLMCRPRRLYIAGQRFSLDTFIQKRMVFLSLCVCLFPKLKLIDYNAPFKAQSAGRGLIKHFAVICKWAAPWRHVMVLHNCVSCSCLTAPDSHVAVTLLNARPGPAVAWPTSLCVFCLSVIPSLPYLQVRSPVWNLLPHVTFCKHLLLFPDFLWWFRSRTWVLYFWKFVIRFPGPQMEQCSLRERELCGFESWLCHLLAMTFGTYYCSPLWTSISSSVKWG